MRYVLDRYGGVMQLVAAEPRVGGPGLVGQHPGLVCQGCTVDTPHTAGGGGCCGAAPTGCEGAAGRAGGGDAGEEHAGGGARVGGLLAEDGDFTLQVPIAQPSCKSPSQQHITRFGQQPYYY